MVPGLLALGFFNTLIIHAVILNEKKNIYIYVYILIGNKQLATKHISKRMKQKSSHTIKQN